MIAAALLVPAFLILGSAPLPTPLEPAGPVACADAFEELDAQYEVAVEAWSEELGRTKGLKERRALREAHPALEFWPRFEGLADGGEGRALLWMVNNLREKGVKSRERAAAQRPYYLRLAREHSSAEWFGEVLEQLGKDSRHMDDDFVLSLYLTVLEKSESDEHRAGALYQAASALLKSEAEGAAERAEAFRARLEQEFPETTWAEKLRQQRALEAVQVGKVAPDFAGRTIDGFEFKLSEYRGKVVMLDFYGFW
jgi:hypothetical protein